MSCGEFNRSQQLRFIMGLFIAAVAMFNACIATYHHHQLSRKWADRPLTNSIFPDSGRNREFGLSSKAPRVPPLGSSSQSLISYPPLQPQHSVNPRQIIFVHIGKTGGETIRQTLRVACRMRQNPTLQESCLAKFRNDPNLRKSPLNQQTIGTIHCLLMVPANALSKASTVLVSARNPIERVISWFRYLHPANCNPLVDKQSTACNVKKALRRERKEARNRKKEGGKGGGKQSWTSRFFECFDSLPEVGLALKGGASSAATKCSALAQMTIRGAASPISSHMHFNYEYYWNQTLTLRPDLETMVVRTEFLWEDLDHVQSLLHVESLQENATNTTSTQYNLPPRNNHTHGSESHRHVDSISGPALEYLCCALSREIYFYAGWILRAVNLDRAEKRKAMAGVTDYCKSPNDLVWTDLVTIESVLCTYQ